jgi:DNA-binding IscR family transcriptional regulator
MRGRNGGVTLNKPASQIRLHEVVQLFMKIDDFKNCFLGLKRCDGSCGLHIRWRIISEQFDKLLNETTIDQIL